MHSEDKFAGLSELAQTYLILVILALLSLLSFQHIGSIARITSLLVLLSFLFQCQLFIIDLLTRAPCCLSFYLQTFLKLPSKTRPNTYQLPPSSVWRTCGTWLEALLSLPLPPKPQLIPPWGHRSVYPATLWAQRDQSSSKNREPSNKKE